MSDSLNWLKLGARSRTPTTPRSTSSLDQNVVYRRPGSSRISNHPNRASPTESDYERARNSAIDDDATPSDLRIRGDDQIWYNPSLDQMVEALQVFLMTHDVFTPIPIIYNSYVLHLVEGFANAEETIRKVESAYEESKQTLKQNLEQFKQVADEWQERESQYRAEVKRLEVLLSKTSRDGLEAVVLARAGSVVDRSSERDGFLSRLDQFTTRRAGGMSGVLSPDCQRTPTPCPLEESTLLTWRPPLASESKPSGLGQALEIEAQQSQETGGCDMVSKDLPFKQAPVPKILDEDNDFLMSEKFRHQHAVTAGFARGIENRLGHRRGISQQLGTTSCDQHQPSPHNLFEPTKIGIETTTHSFHTGPKTPSSVEAYVASELASYTESMEHFSEAAAAGPFPGQGRHHSRFSFEAGDDFGGLPDRRVESHKPNSPGPWRQDQYEITDTADTETRQARANNATSSIAISGCSGNSSPPEDTASSAFSSRHGPHAVVAGHTGRLESRDPVPTRQHIAGISLSQEYRGLGSLEHTPSLKQENPQKQQGATDARIAASRAVANIGNLTRPKN